jgi:Ca2+/Na+ antiporter
MNKIKLDSIVGFIFLGAGTSIPEAVSSVIVSMQGNSDIGINNAIASNIYDILFCLGVSWTARTVIAPLVSGKPWVSNNL